MHPYLKSIGDSSQLYVHDKPFLVLGAELHNSTASNIEFLKPILPKLVDYNINTVFLPISWEVIEPEEGKFDFSHLDKILALFREYNLNIGLLWFGSFKNGESSYIPVWMKKDPKRFKRSVTIKQGKLITTKTLSVFCQENVAADVRAFSALMSHLKNVDGTINTVVAVQVQNESGVLWDSRDRNSDAELAFEQSVPQELLSNMSTRSLAPTFATRFPKVNWKGNNWCDVFGGGDYTDEVFMAWYYARYIDQVAAAGKDIYPVPLFINVAINTPDSSPPDKWKRPGQYPSGGVVPHMMDVYQIAAKHIDIIAPDMYYQRYEELCEAYRHGNNPLLIPETRRDDFAAERLFYTYGKWKAIGVSPFGIDTVWEESVLFKKHYGVLKQVAPYILEAQANDRIFGFYFDDTEETHPQTYSFGSITAHINRAHSYGKPQKGFGLILQLSEDEFIGAGYGFTVVFSSDCGKRVEILSIHEGHFPNGQWQETRRLNGDESASNSRWQFPVVKPDFGDYKVPICTPATTAISRCKVFQHEDIHDMYP
ncbi:hypothetical protein TRVA0_088S00188 [Trichomonascus vanleenenianus]|uniref:uncharacterized protein n=1 Tax=Trichomonascus vanleenenianus TaxID=2268995 RepID=UPI003ECB67FA